MPVGQLGYTWLTGDIITATRLEAMKNDLQLDADRANWSTAGTIRNVVGQLAWKNFGNNHTIFDASAGTSPSGTLLPSTANANIPWTASFPALMGWNGVNTYGVRVDSSRNSENLGGQLPAWYTDIPARQGYTSVNRAGDTMTGILVADYDPASGNWSEAGLRVQGAGSGVGVPRIAFHASGFVAPQLGMFPNDNSEHLAAIGTSGAGYTQFRAGEYRLGNTVIVDSGRNASFAQSRNQDLLLKKSGTRGYLIANDANAMYLVPSASVNGEDWDFNAGLTMSLGANLSWRGNTVFHTGNDGVGSTLDADFWRGLTPTAFVNSATRGNWASQSVLDKIVGGFAWRNFGSGHSIIDASAGLSPEGNTINNTNSQFAWGAGNPTLVGWNGVNTYGVRVDSSRNSENLGGLAPTDFVRALVRETITVTGNIPAGTAVTNTYVRSGVVGTDWLQATLRETTGATLAGRILSGGNIELSLYNPGTSPAVGPHNITVLVYR